MRYTKTSNGFPGSRYEPPEPATYDVEYTTLDGDTMRGEFSGNTEEELRESLKHEGIVICTECEDPCEAVVETCDFSSDAFCVTCVVQSLDVYIEDVAMGYGCYRWRSEEVLRDMLTRHIVNSKGQHLLEPVAPRDRRCEDSECESLGRPVARSSSLDFCMCQDCVLKKAMSIGEKLTSRDSVGIEWYNLYVLRDVMDTAARLKEDRRFIERAEAVMRCDLTEHHLSENRRAIELRRVEIANAAMERENAKRARVSSISAAA